MIVVCINCYNDMPLIVETIDSIYTQVDRIICVDGRYRDFPSGYWYSTDGTIEYLSSLKKVELVFATNLFEADKRNVYMDMLFDDDTVLVLDGDEIVEGIIHKLDEVDIGLVRLGDPADARSKYLATRFFKYRRGLRHNGIHFILELGGVWFNNRRQALNGFKSKHIDSFKITHQHKQRRRTRKELKSAYRIAARKREEQFKIAPYE
jgi:hypothetical protein